MTYETAIHLSRPILTVTLADHAGPASTARGGAAAQAADIPGMHQAELERQLRGEREAIQRILKALQEASSNLQARHRQSVEELQQAAVELAVAVASKVVHEKVAAGDYALEEQVSKAVQKLNTRAQVTVRLNPDDLALLTRRLGEHQPLFGGDQSVQFLADPSLHRGDCVAQAEEVSVLAQLDNQLAELRQHLLRSVSDAEAERRKAMPGDRNLRRFPDRRQTA